MREIVAKPLEHGYFMRYGTYSYMLAPAGDKIGGEPVEFYRDMEAVHYPALTGYSVVKTWKRAMLVDEAERHTSAVEGLLPLDGDVVIFVAPAGSDEYPAADTEAFIVPKGTLVFLRAGVWHKAPFPLDGGCVSSLIILPERAYANDCLVVKLPPEDILRITLP